ncbi:TonB-dependent receptor [Flavobacteriaceae bacterium KMM 6897]|nr:TonB-dependent receptor [Flavobacteriaceae bacterium KMM 6897]MEB8347190.1 TonB-dependent receptor [Flavobacteriaceae bacterium KMM 6898]
MKITSLKSFLMFGAFLCFALTKAQTVSGTVSDADGAPLPGANVLVKGTTNGTQTDFDGNFSINADSNATLVFSYIGFMKQEVAIDGRTTISVSMAEDSNLLTEVVVTGYSTQTRGDITGAVSSVDMSEATKAPIVNAAEALEGRVTGVTVTNSGAPGGAPKITIRGFGTSNNTNPLYIIDGVQTDNASVLNSINPNDIDQMNVLKDAAAAIYGARASNGVVIITTKSGGYNMDKAKISFDFYTGFSEATNLPDLLNTQQHGEMIFQSLANDGSPLSHPQYGSGASPVVPTSLNGYTRVVSYDPIVRGPASATITPGGTNWLDAITQNALLQSASVSLSNGTETGKYYMSANYLNREGIQINTGFEQATTKLNSEFKIGDKVRIGEHLTTSFSNTKSGVGEALENGIRSSPLIPLFDDEGRFAGTGAQGTGNARSPLAQLERSNDNYNKLFRVFGDIYLSAELIDGLTFKTTIGGNLENFRSRSFQALDPEHGEPLGTNTLAEQNIDNYNWTWSNTLNYSTTFGAHNLNVLAGIEAVEDGSKGKGVSRTGFLFETPDFYLLQNGSGTPNIDYAYDGATSLFSIFGTANYSFQGKYFATATVRRDESSRFQGDNKSDVFPSFSAGWLLSQEDFFPLGSIVSRLKLKGSWGQLGNQTLPASNPTINISNLNEGLANYAFDGSNISTGAILSQVGNPDLKWETSVATNFGADLGLLSNTLNISLDIFNIKTEDLITRDNSLISSTAIDAQAPLVNLGSVQNTGFDLSVAYNNETSSGWSYGIQANISKYKNEVTDLISDFQVGRTDLRGGAVTRTEVGRPISSFYGRVVDGFDANGRFAYKDINNDGTINDDDRTYIGSPHPDFTYGLNLSTAYKGIDISLFFTGSQGNDLYNYNKIYTDFPTFFDGNRSVRVLDSWTPSNTNATLPALSSAITNSETNSNSYFVEDGSYLRLKNLQIGYSLPSDIVDKLGMDSFRLYVQGTNLFTVSGYDGFDPEIISNDNLSLGVDFQVYPPSRIVSIGANVKL